MSVSWVQWEGGRNEGRNEGRMWRQAAWRIHAKYMYMHVLLGLSMLGAGGALSWLMNRHNSLYRGRGLG